MVEVYKIEMKFIPVADLKFIFEEIYQQISDYFKTADITTNDIIDLSIVVSK